MPSGRTLEAGKAVIKLSLQDKVSQGLNKVAGKMKVIGGIAAAAGGTIVTAFAAATKQFVDMGDSLNDMSERTGFAVESLSKLSYAAKQSGTSIEAVEKAAKGMAKLLTSASMGAASSAQTLETLGLSLDEIKGQTPDQQFMALASAIANIDDPTTRAAMAMKVFGKSGADLLPLLSGGANGMRELFAEAEKLGLVLSEKDAAAAAELDDALNKLESQVQGITAQIGKATVGPLSDLAESLSVVLTGVIELVKENPEVAKGIAAVGAAAAVAGAAAVVLGGALAACVAHPIIAGVAALTAGAVALAAAFVDVKEAVDGAFKMLLKLQGMSPAGIEALEKMRKHFKRWEVPQSPAGAASSPTALGAPGSVANPMSNIPMASGTDSSAMNARMQGNLARLGLNGYTPNTSDPSGRAGAQLVKQGAMAAWNAISSKVADVDAEFGISEKIGQVRDGIESAMDNFGDGGKEGSGAALATMDSRNAELIFGALGSSKETKEQTLLADIFEVLERIERKPGGIPIV